jgi:hypothetical protein
MTTATNIRSAQRPSSRDGCFAHVASVQPWCGMDRLAATVVPTVVPTFVRNYGHGLERDTCIASIIRERLRM